MQGFLRQLTAWLQGDPRPKRRTRFQLEQLEDRCLLSNAPLPILNSDPAAPASLYLDFSGMYEPTWGAYSNVTTPQFHLDGTGPGFTPHEVAVIDEVWERVSEIYSPFNINVTTSAPADLSHGKTQIVAIGGSYNDWFHTAAGGISYVGSFANPSLPNVSHVFVDGTAGVAQYIAIAAAHEAGHGFGLNHQSTFDASGNLLQEYNPGDSSSAPIMGLAYNATRALWWVGPADTGHGEAIQDDEAVIASPTNGFGYRPDAFGQSFAGATALSTLNGQVAAAGVIDTPTSADYFSFTTAGGAANFAVNTAAVGPTLHARLELWSSAGLIAVGDSATTLGQSISTTLAAGQYFLVVRSYGGNGDVGQYQLTAQAAPAAAALTQSASIQTLSGQVLAVSQGRDAQGRSELFGVGLDSQVYTRTLAVNGAWSAWSLLTPGVVKSLSAGQDAQGRPEVFVVGADYQVWTSTSDVSGHWSGWRLVGPGAVKSISAGSDAQGRPEVFAIGFDSQVWSQHSGAGGWSGWQPVSPGAVRAISAGRDAQGRSEVFAIGFDYQVWAQDSNANGAWQGWSLLAPGAVKAISAAPDAQGRPDVYAIGFDNQVWTLNSTAAGAWSYWQLLAPGRVTGLSAGLDALGRPDLFVLDAATLSAEFYTPATGGAAAAPVLAPPISGAAATTRNAAVAPQTPLSSVDGTVHSSAILSANAAGHGTLPDNPFMPLCMCPWCVAARLAAQRH
jgi:hypothetical protein